MSSLLEYECPACGGILEFDTASQKLKCPYCDSMFEVQKIKEIMQEKQKKAEEATDGPITSEAEDWVDPNLLIYVCQSCGGEIIGDKNLGATSCPYCGNNVVMTKQFTGALKPDYIIPFKLDKNAAKEALAAHFRGKKLLNKSFRDENRLDEVKGVYVPFWIFNVDASGNASYDATKVRSWSDSKYHYTETKYYRIERAGVADYEGIPADGSTKMADDLMDSVEPYNYDDAVPFESAYLAGFLADKYDVEPEELMPRINPRVKNTMAQNFRNTVSGYATIKETSCNIQVKKATTKYMLLPVWVLTTKWKDKVYTFAMNGQTGKFVGNLPLDGAAYAKWLLAITGIGGIIGGSILFLAKYLG